MKRLLFIATIVASIAACGGGENTENNTSQPDAGTADLGDTNPTVDMSEDTGPLFVCPDEGEKYCGEKCVNVQISMEHCGTCGNACVAGEMTCTGEDGCACLGGRIMCGSRCYDPDSTRDHCGECGIACPSSDACVGGECIEISTNPAVLGVLDATNEARSMQQDCGVHGIKSSVGPVQLNDELNAAAQAHAEDMAANNFMEHTGSDGSSVGVRTQRAGYSSGFVGENIARGYTEADAVVAGWVDSDGHCQNLMTGDYTEMGVGRAISPTTGEHFWAQVFGRP